VKEGRGGGRRVACGEREGRGLLLLDIGGCCMLKNVVVKGVVGEGLLQNFSDFRRIHYCFCWQLFEAREG